jgi:urease accessory protein UreE
MLTITERVPGEGPADDRLTLPFDQRQKSRLRVKLDSGDEAAVNVNGAPSYAAATGCVPRTGGSSKWSRRRSR